MHAENLQSKAQFIECFKPVSELLEEGVEEGVFPGCALIVGKSGYTLFQGAYGQRYSKASRNSDTLSPITSNTVFDIAGLTAVVVTTTLVMKLVEAGKLLLDDRISRYLQGFCGNTRSKITVGQLLSHTSGLPQWMPFFEDLLKEHSGARLGIITSRAAREFVYMNTERLALKTEPGTKQVFSDLGLIVLGQIIEMMTGLPLDKAAYKFITQPLGLKSSSYIDLSMIKRRGIHPVTDVIAPTEECPWRKRILCGEVHDDNAWVMGGIAPHSGFFASAPDLHVFAHHLLECYNGKSEYISQDVIRQFWAGSEGSIRGSIRYGWDSPSRENGLYDSILSDQAVGACGFTGCSLWIEPSKGIDVVFMTNRIHPTRANKKIIPFRVELHNAILKALGE